MHEWFYASLEYTHWGYNMSTLGFIGTVLFTCVESWTTLKQNATIRDNDSGESVSVIFFSILFFYLISFGIYGIFQKSISEIFNGFFLGTLHMPLLYGLWRSKGFTQREKYIFCIAATMIPIMIFIPWKDIFYVAISLIVTLASVDQVRELYVNKNAGVVEISLLWTYFCSVAFWVMYATATDQIFLSVICQLNLLIIMIAIILWYKYRSKPV